MEDKNLIESIKGGSYQVLGDVYEKYRDECLNWLIRKFNCDLEVARDIYQNSIIILYENIIQKKLISLESSIKTYLFSIAKNKMMEQQRKDSRKMGINRDIIDESPDDPLEMDINWQNKIDVLRNSLEQLGDPCFSLLRMFYYQKMKIAEIRVAMEYKTDESAKNQKYKCLQRLRKKYRALGFNLN